jgi:Cu/Ag efflux protein CusF
MKVLRCLTIFASLSIASNAFAQDDQRGTVTDVDESSGSITIQLIPNGTVGSSTGPNSAKFAVQDGLLFNTLAQGDDVTFSSHQIDGVNTITKIQKR